MKSLIYCLVVFMTLVACSDDDDHVVEPLDFAEQTLGKWRLTDRIPHGVEYCELQSTIEFKEENELHVVVYNGDEPGNCDFFERDGTWEYEDRNKMKIQLNGEEPNYVWVNFGEGLNSIELNEDGTEVIEIFGKVN